MSDVRTIRVFSASNFRSLQDFGRRTPHAQVIAYVLMPNHDHVLLKALDDQVSAAMQKFSISYTKLFAAPQPLLPSQSESCSAVWLAGAVGVLQRPRIYWPPLWHRSDVRCLADFGSLHRPPSRPTRGPRLLLSSTPPTPPTPAKPPTTGYDGKKQKAKPDPGLPPCRRPSRGSHNPC